MKFDFDEYDFLEDYCENECGQRSHCSYCDSYKFLENYLKEHMLKNCIVYSLDEHPLATAKEINFEETNVAVKDKEGKPQMRLILPHAAEALVRIREYGLKKYPQADNWKSVPKEDWTDAMLRHLMKYIGGEETDEESGMPHLWHALCNLSYLIELEWKENAK